MMLKTAPLGLALALAACATQPAPAPAVAAPVAVEVAPSSPAAIVVPKGDQWLFGSGEGSAAALQTYRALTDFALAAARKRPRSSVILMPGQSPVNGAAPLSFAPCGDKPLAAVFDADETLIWNIPPTRYNVEHRDAVFEKVWDAWERTGAGHAKPIAGVVEALAALREAGITPIANTNRAAATAAGTEAALKAAGLGDFVHGQTLFLKGDDQEGSSKDGRRARIAERYCVVAMAGDQLGDFSQAFNVKDLPVAVRRAAAVSGPASSLWGRGWFMLSNPSYGPGLRGDLDDVYGPDEWRPDRGAE